MKSSVLHPRSDSRNWPRSSEWALIMFDFRDVFGLKALSQHRQCSALSPMAKDFWVIPPFVVTSRNALLSNMVDECQKSLKPIFFTVHTFVKPDFKGNCAKKSTLWLLICCKKLILYSQDKQSMEKIR